MLQGSQDASENEASENEDAETTPASSTSPSPPTHPTTPPTVRRLRPKDPRDASESEPDSSSTAPDDDRGSSPTPPPDPEAWSRPPSAAQPVPVVMEDKADQEGYEVTKADEELMRIAGDYLHQNPGLHLDGGIPREDEKAWKRRYKKLMVLHLTHYDVPDSK